MSRKEFLFVSGEAHSQRLVRLLEGAFLTVCGIERQLGTGLPIPASFNLTEKRMLLSVVSRD